MTTDFRTLGRRVNNWGRWGEDDERGTLNFITPDVVARAAGCVRTGKMFDLGINFDERGPQPGGGRINPVRTMRQTGHEQIFEGAVRIADDVVFMPLQCATQWDALAHVHYDGELYNGFPNSELSSRGAGRCSVDKLSPGIAGRGVLLDIAGLYDQDWLDADQPIRATDLEGAVERQGVEITRGDILLIRTGWRRNLLVQRDRRTWSTREPGLTLDCVDWLYERDIAALAADNWGIELFPGEVAGETLPVHMVLLRDMGMPLGEMFDLESLAAECRTTGRWDCFLAAPVLKFTHGVGSPTSPLAIT